MQKKIDTWWGRWYNTTVVNMRGCWNRQTGTFEVRVSIDVGVQVPSLAPNHGRWRKAIFRLLLLPTRDAESFPIRTDWKQVLRAGMETSKNVPQNRFKQPLLCTILNPKYRIHAWGSFCFVQSGLAHGLLTTPCFFVFVENGTFICYTIFDKYEFAACLAFLERELIMEFNEKLQELRKQKGLTQDELAESLYVSRTAISKWESGRGYPNIDSLKAIAKFFGITIDKLLSGDELLTIAEEDAKQKEKHFLDLAFGLLDCSVAMFFFLPFFGQKADAIIQEVSLLSLAEISSWLRMTYFVVVIGIIVLGILTLALQNCHQAFWMKNKSKISLVLNALGVFVFIISSQPYAAVFLFIFLAIKVLMLTKKQ